VQYFYSSNNILYLQNWSGSVDTKAGSYQELAIYNW